MTPPKTQSDVDPEDVLQESAPEEVPADSPPKAANYRPADLQGVSCAFCAKFQYETAVEEDGSLVPTGICELYDARVRGDHVSDSYAESSPPLDENGEEDWNFSADPAQFSEVYFQSTSQQESDGFLIKEILKTGTWDQVPTAGGVVDKPLRIVRDGPSDPGNYVISLDSLVQNFNDGPVQRVQIPLSDTPTTEHDNSTRVNTGFVESIWIEDTDEGAKLLSKMRFTEPDIREKILRGTYSDVSCGIPMNLTRGGKDYSAVLEHVCITNKPFIEGLGPFLEASAPKVDKGKLEVMHFAAQTGAEEEKAENEPEEQEEDMEKILEALAAYIQGDPDLSDFYEVEEIEGDRVRISHKVVEQDFAASYESGDEIKLSAPSTWEMIDPEPSQAREKAEPKTPPRPVRSELEQARDVRELLFSVDSKRAKEANMPLSREELDRLELSDETKAGLLAVLEENVTLRQRTHESEADQRIDELKRIGLEDRPGFLKFYRQVYLADDGGPAIVLLSDQGQKQSVKAIEILDHAIDAIKGPEGKITLSAQAVETDDPRPPVDAKGENKDFDERLADAKKALGRS